jgi:hypothetical protein
MGSWIPHKAKDTWRAVLKLMGDDLTLFKSISAITIPGNILRLGNSDHDRLRHPANDRRTKIRVERMRTSEANLDRLWEAVDRHLERSTITLPYLLQLLNSNRKLHRTSEYVAYQEDSQALPPPLMESLSKYYWKFQSSTESTINHALSAAPKPKVKTRPQAQVSQSAIGAVSTAIENLAIISVAADPREKVPIPVKTKSMKVFETLFYVGTANRARKHVDWKDFRVAMQAIGFASEKRFGSAWHF